MGADGAEAQVLLLGVQYDLGRYACPLGASTLLIAEIASLKVIMVEYLQAHWDLWTLFN